MRHVQTRGRNPRGHAARSGWEDNPRQCALNEMPFHCMQDGFQTVMGSELLVNGM
jgi:hypothetical protein